MQQPLVIKGYQNKGNAAVNTESAVILEPTETGKAQIMITDQSMVLVGPLDGIHPSYQRSQYSVETIKLHEQSLGSLSRPTPQPPLLDSPDEKY